MFLFRKIIIARTVQKITSLAKISLSLFFLQFFGSFVYLYSEVRNSAAILSSPFCPQTSDAIIYHYFKLALLTPIVGLSLIFAITGFLTGWDFDFEQELIAFFIFLIWLAVFVLEFFSTIPVK